MFVKVLPFTNVSLKKTVAGHAKGTASKAIANENRGMMFFMREVGYGLSTINYTVQHNSLREITC